MYKLGKTSLKNLKGINTYIVEVVKRAITITKTDFGIINDGGLRTAEMQNDIYKRGNSKCDGYIKKSYHQTGNAVDLIPYVDGEFTWANKQAFINILTAWSESEKELRKEGKIPVDVYFHHGIFWKWKDINKDGILTISDRLGWDAAHHEIRSIKQKI